MTSHFDPSQEHAALIRKLESISDLSEDDKLALTKLPLEMRTLAEGVDIVREGDRPSHACLIVEGLACRYRILGEGQRQIMSFHMAGDVPDLQSLHIRTMDHSLGTLTPLAAAFIPHTALHELLLARPSLTVAFWRDTLIDAAVFREWLAGVGRRSAHARVAHLLCELFMRMKAVGLVDGETMDLPVTQAELGDSLGLSAVHINRVMQDLRADGLIGGRGRTLVVSDWPALKAVGDFDSGYLHLRKLAA